MSLDLTKIAFDTRHPIDKVVQEGEVTIVNDGATVNFQESKIVTSTVANDYGRAALARARWSVDGGINWQGMDAQMVYTYTYNYNDGVTSFSDQSPGLRAAISIGSDNNFVYFRTANGYHGTVNDDGVTQTFTPTSQTFIIQYVLYERE